MAIITLTTDMGLKDHYVAVVKGSILSQLPGAVVVDISHQVTPFDTAQAAFVLRNAYPAFPEGSVHLIGVNPEADERVAHLAVNHEGHWFLGADNGIFSLLFDGRPVSVHAVDLPVNDADRSFPLRGVLATAACHLARGGSVEEIAQPVRGFSQRLGFVPSVDQECIRGAVMHVDGYGNVVTNIHRDVFLRFIQDRGFRIRFGRSQYDIGSISTSYGDVPQGERLALFGANGFLEIAVNKGADGTGGGASRLFGLHVQDPIRIELAAAGRQRVAS